MLQKLAAATKKKVPNKSKTSQCFALKQRGRAGPVAMSAAAMKEETRLIFSFSFVISST